MVKGFKLLMVSKESYKEVFVQYVVHWLQFFSWASDKTTPMYISSYQVIYYWCRYKNFVHIMLVRLFLFLLQNGAIGTREEKCYGQTCFIVCKISCWSKFQIFWATMYTMPSFLCCELRGMAFTFEDWFTSSTIIYLLTVNFY